MKAWTYPATVIASVALGACGGEVFVDGSTSGSGGNGGASSATGTASVMDVVATSTSGGSFSTTTGQIDPCNSGSDCSTCPTLDTCFNCEAVSHPEGSGMFLKLIECVYCQACFTTCQSMIPGVITCSPPTAKNGCDTGSGATACIDTSSDPAINGCIPCAEDSTCKPALDACKADPDCVAFNTAISVTCPSN